MKLHENKKFYILFFLTFFMFSSISMVSGALIIDNVEQLNAIDLINKYKAPLRYTNNQDITFFADKGELKFINGSAILTKNVGIGDGIVSVIDSKGITAEVKFYTDMPNTPFSIWRYGGITADRQLVKELGTQIHNNIYSDEFGVVTYVTNGFSTQILSFPDPLIHVAGGETTTYYLDYFFEDYDRVRIFGDGLDMIENYTSTAPHEYDPQYTDALVDVYMQLQHPRARLVSQNYPDGFAKSITIRAYDSGDDVSYVEDEFFWILTSASGNQILFENNIDDIVIAREGSKSLFLTEYFSEFDAWDIIGLTCIDESVNDSFNIQINSTNITHPESHDEYITANISIDLDGVGNDVWIRLVGHTTDINLTACLITVSNENVTNYNTSNIFTVEVSESAPLEVSIGDSLVMCYSADETDPNQNSVTYNFNLTDVGSPATRSGKVGALAYDNADNDNTNYRMVEEFSAIPTQDSMSVASWVYLDTGDGAQNTFAWEIGVATSHNIIGYQWGVSPTYSMQSDYGGASDGVGDTGTLGTWYHYVVTFNVSDNNTTFYVNGVKKNSVSRQHDITNNTLWLMQPPEGASYGEWDGAVDELMVFDVPLTPSQVAEIYNSTSGVSCDYVLSTISAPPGDPPAQILNFQDAEHEYDDQVFYDYGDYFTDYTGITVQFLNESDDLITITATIEDSADSYNDSYLNFSLIGNDVNVRLFVTAGFNDFNTTVNITAYNNVSSITDSYSMIIGEPVIDPEPPVQVFVLDSVTMLIGENDTIDFGAYFSNYLGIAINGTDPITSAPISLSTIIGGDSVLFANAYIELNLSTVAGHLVLSINSLTSEWYEAFSVEISNPYGQLDKSFYIDINAPVDPEDLPVNGSSLIQDAIFGFAGWFLDADDLTLTQQLTFVGIVMIVTMILLAILFGSSGNFNAQIFGMIALIFIGLELVFFISISYIPVIMVIVIGLISALIIYAMFKGGFGG